MKHVFLALMYVGLTAFGIAQQLQPSRHHPVAGGITYVQAANKAKAFLTLLDIEPGNVATYKVVLQKRPAHPDRREWRVYTANSRIKVDSQSTMVTSYVNAKREDDRYRGRGRTGEKFTTSDSVAKAHLRAIATKIGIPTNVQMTGFKMVGDGIGQDSSPMGSFSCVFKNEAGQIVGTLACDIQDGIVLEHSRSRQD